MRHVPAAATRLSGMGAITVAVLVLVFAAFDDITTDTATAFPLEYSFLIASAGWLLFVTWTLRRRHRLLAGVSVLAVAGSLWAQREIRPGIVPGLWPEYVVITAAYLWFWVLASTLLWLAWRADERGGAPAAARSRDDPSESA